MLKRPIVNWKEMDKTTRKRKKHSMEEKNSYLGRIEESVENLQQFEWKHHNIILLLLSIVIAYYFVKSPTFTMAIDSLGNLGYLGAFIAGLFFTYGLTTAPATAALLVLGDSLKNPLLLSIIAAPGAMLSDYLIFSFIKDRLMDELELTGKEIFGKKIRLRIRKSSFISRFIPIIAGFIIASPLPDELGAAIFGASHIHPKKFLLYSFLFNFIGIFLIASYGNIFF